MKLRWWNYFQKLINEPPLFWKESKMRWKNGESIANLSKLHLAGLDCSFVFGKSFIFIKLNELSTPGSRFLQDYIRGLHLFYHFSFYPTLTTSFFLVLQQIYTQIRWSITFFIFLIYYGKLHLCLGFVIFY